MLTGLEDVFALVLVCGAEELETSLCSCGVDVLLDDVGTFLRSLDPLNQRLLRTLDVVDGEVMLAASSCASVVSEPGGLSVSALTAFASASTSSASRYHFRRRVYRPHPS